MGSMQLATSSETIVSRLFAAVRCCANRMQALQSKSVARTIPGNAGLAQRTLVVESLIYRRVPVPERLNL